jgi:hypothetical protein
MAYTNMHNQTTLRTPPHRGFKHVEPTPEDHKTGKTGPIRWPLHKLGTPTPYSYIVECPTTNKTVEIAPARQPECVEEQRKRRGPNQMNTEKVAPSPWFGARHRPTIAFDNQSCLTAEKEACKRKKLDKHSDKHLLTTTLTEVEKCCNVKAWQHDLLKLNSLK